MSADILFVEPHMFPFEGIYKWLEVGMQRSEVEINGWSDKPFSHPPSFTQRAACDKSRDAVQRFADIAMSFQPVMAASISVDSGVKAARIVGRHRTTIRVRQTEIATPTPSVID